MTTRGSLTIKSLPSCEISTDPLTVLTHAHDASHYLLGPAAVARPVGVRGITEILRSAREGGWHLTFRSGGTSLSGQSVSDGILVDTRRHFRGMSVLDDGRRVRAEPGVTVRQVNTALMRYGRRLGPDPASESACTIGGVVANNSSGMLCGTTQNAYRTIESAVLVLPSGTVIDTGQPDADAELKAKEPGLWRGLSQLRDRIRATPRMTDALRRQFSIKNTMGYGLNAFLDHETCADILTHLAVGSEGTLAFIAEATFATVPRPSHMATALLVFSSLGAANDALPALTETGLAAIELMDSSSLAVAAGDPGAPALISGLHVGQHAALLVEHQCGSAAELTDAVAATLRASAGLGVTAGGDFTTDQATRSAYWHVRKGLYAAVAGHRPPGTTALLEDIAVPVPDLAGTCRELGQLFQRFGYPDSVIFGHAKDGNIHFLINERFDQDERLASYQRFTEEMVSLVLSRGGTLKAEHGTGRIMAPFVERQYGSELYDCMRQVKEICDPHHLLNPGVVITDDPRAHLRDLKPAPATDPEIDRCVECGYCEPVCPSKDLTLTPRQRIAARRELVKAEARGDTALANRIKSAYDYAGVQTCAVDGMCETACPVMINTGDLVRRLRAEAATPLTTASWKAAASAWGPFTAIASAGMTAASRLPASVPAAASRIGRTILDPDNVPQWSRDLPGGGQRRRHQPEPDAVAIFMPTCTTTMFGKASDDLLGSSDAFLTLCERAGVPVRVPDGIAALCCGMPWKSKGMSAGLATMTQRTLRALWEATDGGQLPVVTDSSSCTDSLLTMTADPGTSPVKPMRVIDAVEFIAAHVLPDIPAPARKSIPSLVLHPTCASERVGSAEAMLKIAGRIASQVTVPDSWACCAFAGDRGLLHPELTASATAAEATEVTELHATAHASSNRTCEIGMTRATGQTYVHILELLEQHTRPSIPREPD